MVPTTLVTGTRTLSKAIGFGYAREVMTIILYGYAVYPSDQQKGMLLQAGGWLVLRAENPVRGIGQSGAVAHSSPSSRAHRQQGKVAACMRFE
jgi:hypothetical protein